MSKARDIANAGTALATVDATELGYLDGVTSAIQTQMDAKLATATASTTYVPNTLTTTTGDIIYASGADTPARLAVGSTDDVLTVAGGVPTWAAPAGGGKVLQVVQATDITSFSTASASYVDTGLSVTITPSSATSTIMILADMPNTTSYNASTSTETRGAYRLMVGATQLMVCEMGVEGFSSTANKNVSNGCGFSYLDSPATTSATTYKVQGKRTSTGSTFGYSGIATQFSSIIAIEIGA